MKRIAGVSILLVAAGGSAPLLAGGQQDKRPFTVADEIGLTFFGGGESNPESKKVASSPDGSYFAIDTERGRLDLNRLEDSLRIYRTEDIQNFLSRPGAEPPSPFWIITPPPQKTGSIITDWRWLRDSSGVAFLEETESGNHRLILADLRKRTLEPLTPEAENVTKFDVSDRQHLLYASFNREAARKRIQKENDVPAIVGTGGDFAALLFPTDPLVVDSLTRTSLWAVIGGKRLEVKKGEKLGNLVLSPDGKTVITTQDVTPPRGWKTLYPPPYPSAPYDALREGGQVQQYFRLDLESGGVRALVDAPRSRSAGWGDTLAFPNWSRDGKAVLLPDTFLSSKEPSPACLALIDLTKGSQECVVPRKKCSEGNGAAEDKECPWITDVRFADENKDRVMVTYLHDNFSRVATTEYRRTATGAWEPQSAIEGSPEERGSNGIRVTVKEGLDEPPLVVASDSKVSRVLWNPNPQLEQVSLGQAKPFNWDGPGGRHWRGGLYLPPDFKPGSRYPLVLQTHGFPDGAFLPAGFYPTGFAARALAASGIVVLQVADEGFCPDNTPEEGPCTVSGYESAVRQLAAEGTVDPDKVGIIGFSRTCYYVMEALTRSSLHFRAALITDGMMLDYPGYLMGSEGVQSLYNSMVGAAPVGEGLQQWLKRSPGFNLDKVTTPLLVNSEGRMHLLGMWQPYAGLRALHKPVDLIVLDSDEHVLTNPAVRMASQGGSVDWFRFWLRRYEDPDPAKAEQYNRWRELRKLQEENDKKK